MPLPADLAEEGTASSSTQSLASAPGSYHRAQGVINLSDDTPLRRLSNLPPQRLSSPPPPGDQKWEEGSLRSPSLACELLGEGLKSVVNAQIYHQARASPQQLFVCLITSSV